MKFFVWTLCSALTMTSAALAAQATAAEPPPRSSFLGQLPASFRGEDDYLNPVAVADAYEKAGTDVRAEDFEAEENEKFRLTEKGAATLGKDASPEDLIFPEYTNGYDGYYGRERDTVCQTVDRSGWGHGSYVFRYTKETLGGGAKEDFVFSGGWIPGTSGNTGLTGSMKYMKGRSAPGEGYRIDIPENAAGIYSDFPAPLSVIYRRTQSVLIAAFQSADGQIGGYKVCWSSTKAACQIRGIAKGRYDEPPKTFSNFLNLILVGEDVKSVKERTLLRAKRALGCLVGENEPVEDYVKDRCGGNPKSGLCESAKNACAAYVKAKKDMQCGTDLSRMNFYAFNKKTNQWLQATSR